MANTPFTWKGAVEPASVSPSGNAPFLWKGAIEPTAIVTYSLTAVAIESASEVGTPVLTDQVVYSLTATAIESASEVGIPVITAADTYPRIRRLFVLTGKTDTEE